MAKTIVLAILLYASAANATTLTFEPGAGIITIPGVFAPYSGAVQYVENGMTMTANTGIFEISEAIGLPGYALHMWTTDHNGLQIVTFSLGGTPFNLISADISLPNCIGGSIRSETGAQISSNSCNFPPGPSAPPGPHIDFTQLPGWQGITSFATIFGSSSGDFTIAFDNIVFQTVPEPPVWALMLLGFIGVISVRRR